MRRIFLIISIILLYQNSCFAATAGNSSDPKIPYGPGALKPERPAVLGLKAEGAGGFKFGFDTDWIFGKDLDAGSDISDAELKGQWYMFRAGYNFFDFIEPYVKVGVSNLNLQWYEGADRTNVNGGNEIAIGGGGKLLIFEIPEPRAALSVDGQYVYTSPDIQKVKIGGLLAEPISAAEFDIHEWQITGILSMEFPVGRGRSDILGAYSFVPYVGLGYFDSKTDAKFTYKNTEHSLSSTNNEKLFLVTGCNVNSKNNVSLNVEGRWLGEAAASGGLTVKF